MKKTLVLGFGALLLAIPAFALADTAIPIGQTPLQLLITVAALEAQESAVSSGQTLACAALFSPAIAQVNEPALLAWGSVGALNPATVSFKYSMWTQNGGTMVVFQQPGTWIYPFTFYNASGGMVHCNAKIVVTK